MRVAFCTKYSSTSAGEALSLPRDALISLNRCIARILEQEAAKAREAMDR